MFVKKSVLGVTLALAIVLPASAQQREIIGKYVSLEQLCTVDGTLASVDGQKVLNGYLYFDLLARKKVCLPFGRAS